MFLYPEYYFLYLINLNIASPYKFIGKTNICIYVYIHISTIHTYILLCDVMCIYKICDVYILYIHGILLYNIYIHLYINVKNHWKILLSVPKLKIITSF